MNKINLAGSGLSLRREHMGALMDDTPFVLDFFEIAPENYLDLGGKKARDFRWFSERYPIVAHGLSLSLGGPDPLDEAFLLRIKAFMKMHDIALYTEHLSYCADNGHLYDLLPIPFTEEAVHYVARRIKRTQEILEMPIAIENTSYYAASPIADMDELSFINAVLTEADCGLHLDVNNIYVNSVNHYYDAEQFLLGLPGERIKYCHVAGHDQRSPNLIIDSHGADVIDPVWHLLSTAYQQFGLFPTLLERDFNIPPLADLVEEVEHIAKLQSYWQGEIYKKIA
ncbi:HvfB family MNIO-type RiPP peptide maturase [Methyloprofundus sp.]|uniref:HvfB family MNIO-type RiPP peptide maturase n=1 Tax=Methyloprofundus sp. TaxID=2020875 RepID=UPI003D12CAD2